MILLEEPEYVYESGPRIKCSHCTENGTWFWEQDIYRQHVRQVHGNRKHGRRGVGSTPGSGL